jgi:hypothetical protein
LLLTLIGSSKFVFALGASALSGRGSDRAHLFGVAEEALEGDLSSMLEYTLARAFAMAGSACSVFSRGGEADGEILSCVHLLSHSVR